jgi:hypothetical protein
MWLAFSTSGVAIPFVSSPYVNFGSGFYLWKDSISGKYIIASQLGRTLKVSGIAFVLNGAYNGYAVYSGSVTDDGNYSIYNGDDGPRMSVAPGMGVMQYVLDSAVVGDKWWAASNLYSSQSGTLTAQGCNAGDSSKNLSFSYDLPDAYWQSSAFSGLYEAQGSASGNMYLGRLVLFDNKGYSYMEATAATYGAKSTFSSSAAWGGIRYESGSWRIGSGSGYWQYSGDLPKSSSDGAASFSRVWNGASGEDPYDFDLSLSFSYWSSTPETKKINSFAVAEWI